MYVWAVLSSTFREVYALSNYGPITKRGPNMKIVKYLFLCVTSKDIIKVGFWIGRKNSSINTLQRLTGTIVH